MWASLMAQRVKNLPAVQEMQGTRVQSLGQEDPLEEGMATCSSILARRIPWTEEPGGPQSMVSQRVGHLWSGWACNLMYWMPWAGSKISHIYVYLSETKNVYPVHHRRIRSVIRNQISGVFHEVFFIVLCFFIHLILHTFAEHPGVPDARNGVAGVVPAVKNRVVWGVDLPCSAVGLVRECGKGCGANESHAFPSAWLWTAFSRVVTELALGGSQKEKGSPDPEEQDHGHAAEGWMSGCGCPGRAAWAGTSDETSRPAGRWKGHRCLAKEFRRWFAGTNPLCPWKCRRSSAPFVFPIYTTQFSVCWEDNILGWPESSHNILWENLNELFGWKKKVKSRSVVSNSLQPHGLYRPWNSPGQNTGVGSLSLNQGIFPTQRSNPGLPYCKQILYLLSHTGSPKYLANPI